MMYVHRELDIESRYIFEGEKLRNLLINCTVDVSESASINQDQSLSVLNMLLEKCQITIDDYLARIPRGLVPDTASLIEKGEQV